MSEATEKKERPLTRREKKTVEAAIEIAGQSAKDAGKLGFLTSAIVQATLPHKAMPGKSEFVRENGNYRLHMLAPSDPGLPYGPIPRLILAWLITEAVATRSRTLDIGGSMTAFMRSIGIAPTGGANGSIARFKDQANRLFRCTIQANYTGSSVGRSENTHRGFTLADDSSTTLEWFTPSKVPQRALWQSTVTLSERFYAEIMRYPIPVDMRAIAALKRSSLALDLYVWLTFRKKYAVEEGVVPWEGLARQFGSDYGRLRDFRAAMVDELKHVAEVWPDVGVVPQEDGLLVLPGLPHIPS